jgi:hypothetical protein
MAIEVIRRSYAENHLAPESGQGFVTPPTHLVRDDESPSQEDDLASGPGQDGFQEQSNSETEEETVT